MRKTKRVMLLAFVIMISMMSCNTEELFIEPVGEEVVVYEDEEEVVEEDADPAVDTSLPCDFDLNTIEPNSTILINCIMDLQGQTINVPDNVSILYEGGDIINGTLNFSDASIISGELLNSTITLGGSAPQLKNPTFYFDPTRWGIVQGEVPQDIAQNNGGIMTRTLSLVKDLGATTFSIDKLDAYFYHGDYWWGSILIPSNITLEMTDNTHLRTQLNSPFRGLIYILESENITIKGGFLHGDRNIAGYDNNFNSNLIDINTGINIVVDNVHMVNASTDALYISSKNHAYRTDYVPSNNILVTGCTLDSSARNNLSIVDGHDIIVENCTFLNAGVDLEYSQGRAPRYSIDLEPHVNNQDQPEQKLERVIIRNCYESGSVAGSIVLADGDDYTVEGNTFESRMAMTAASNVKIINNPSLRSIIAGEIGWYQKSRNKNTIISGNTIQNGGIGIWARNQDIRIFDNLIKDCGVGIQFDSLEDSHIYNNRIESNVSNGKGFHALNYVNNVVIENNYIKVLDWPFYFDYVNRSDETYSFTFDNNTFDVEKFGFFAGTYGINFINNTMNTGVRLFNTKNVLLDGNTLKADKPFTIELAGDLIDNLVISNNIIENTDLGGMGNGIKGSISNDGNKNIKISNNQFSVTGYNSGIRISGFNGITVDNNTGYTNNMPLIDYEGDNSTFLNNSHSENVNSTYHIVGNNNTIQ